MSAQDWERLEKNLSRIGQMAALLKLVIGAGAAVVVSIGAVFVWINHTTEGLARTQSSLSALEADRRASTTEWMSWRRTKDDVDIKTVSALENLSRILELQQKQIDRMENRGR